MELFHEPKFWVAVAFIVFIGLTFRKGAEFIRRVLDHRTVKIRTELENAARLREEAEAVLAAYKEKQAQYIKEAEIMLEQARRDAEIIRAHAEQELRAALDARMQQALEKIAQEEHKAVQDVRNHVVDIALSAAQSIIRDDKNKASQEDMIANALKDIERKLH